MSLFYRSLAQIYRRALEKRTQEHLWYHYWNEAFQCLNLRYSTSTALLSTAPQRRYARIDRSKIEVTRDSRPVTRSHTPVDVLMFSLGDNSQGIDVEMPEDDSNDPTHDVPLFPVDDLSFSGTSQSTVEDSDEIDYRTPDCSIFVFDKRELLIVKAVVEHKPLVKLPESLFQSTELNNESEDAVERSQAFTVIARTHKQSREQLRNFFDDVEEESIPVRYIITVGGWYSSYVVDTSNYEELLHGDRKKYDAGVVHHAYQGAEASSNELSDDLKEIWATFTQ